jgi:hypothetical protein
MLRQRHGLRCRCTPLRAQILAPIVQLVNHELDPTKL